MKDYKEPSPFKNFINGITEKILSINTDMDDDYYDEEDGEVDNYADDEPPTHHESAPRHERAERPSAKKTTSNVINFNRENASRRGVEITDPANLEDAARVVDYLLQGIIITVNLESIEKRDAQRVADFLCGAAYSVQATISRISNHIFIITPSGTGVSGGKRDADEVYELPKVASYR